MWLMCPIVGILWLIEGLAVACVAGGHTVELREFLALVMNTHRDYDVFNILHKNII